ncbi:hypothetical protein D3C84_980170 [compost metagenome]
MLRFWVVIRNPLGAVLDGFMVVDRSHRRAPREGVNQELRQTGLVHPRVQFVPKRMRVDLDAGVAEALEQAFQCRVFRTA